jgi:sodium pump decarboxylase gamma subunit
MKKRLLTLCLSLIVVFSLTSCGADINAQKEIYGESRAEIEKDMIQMAQTVNSMNDSELQQLSDKYVNLAEEAKTEVDKNQANMYAQFLSSVKETNGELGKFEEFGDMTVSKAGKTVTCSLEEICSKRNCDLLFVYTIVNDNMKLTGINVNPRYSKLEIFQKALLNVLMGMLIVFSVLILISFIIRSFKIFPYLEERKKNAKVARVVPEPVVEEDENLEDDLELVAVISAAIAASSGLTTDDFVVRQIRRR